MNSRIANDSKQALLEAARALTPEQRLNAYLSHNRLVAKLKAAGDQLRRSQVLPPR